jgi:hypothetical protein
MLIALLVYWQLDKYRYEFPFMEEFVRIPTKSPTHSDMMSPVYSGIMSPTVPG